MTEREQFEKVFPVPKGMAYAEKYHAYMRSGDDLETPKAIYYNESWQVWQAAKTDSAAQVEAIKEQCAVLCETECAQNDGITCAESIREMRIEP